MRRYWIVAAAVVLTFTMSNWASAAPKQGKNKPRPPIGNNPHPVIWGGAKARPAPPKPKAPKQNHAGRNHRDHRGHGRHHPRYHGRFYPSFEYFYGYVPYYIEPYYYDFGYYYYPYSYPPYYMYPPRPLPPVEQPREADPPEERKSARRATNARSTALAWKFIGYGDAQFARREFAEANIRYRKASQNGPQVADAWFRQGFALTAMGRYDLAVGAVRRGMEIDPKWSTSVFELDELFGPEGIAKQAHLDALDQAAEDEPLNADLLFLVGVHLHFDGQQLRAEKYFRRARRIAGDDAEHVLAFLAKEGRGEKRDER